MSNNDTITGIAAYPEYPVTNVPENGDDVSMPIMKAILQDQYNRITFNKENADGVDSSFDNLDTQLGTNHNSNVVPNWNTPGNFPQSSMYKVAIEGVDSQVSINTTAISNINTNVGGGVIGEDLPSYSSDNVITNGDSHNVALGKLDTQVGTNIGSINSISGGLASESTRTDNLVAKVGANADQAPDFTFTSQNFIQKGDTLKKCAEQLDKPLFSQRLSSSYYFQLVSENWSALDVNSLTVVHDDFINTTKIDAGASTPGSYDNIDMSFGNAAAWVLVTTTIPVDPTSNELKIKLRVEGTVSIEFNFAGAPGGPFSTILTQDTYVVAPAVGGNLILRFTGTADSRIHSYMVNTKA